MAGAARSGSACCCAKWRPASWWVWLSVFLCRFFFFFSSPPIPLPSPPHSCLGRVSAANRGGDGSQEGGRELRGSQWAARAGCPGARWLAGADIILQQGGSRSWAGSGAAGGGWGEGRKRAPWSRREGGRGALKTGVKRGENGEKRARCLLPEQLRGREERSGGRGVREGGSAVLL